MLKQIRIEIGYIDVEKKKRIVWRTDTGIKEMVEQYSNGEKATLQNENVV